ncbi:hypothetical protein N2152v2_007181 [Parachlorella kessleri]
MTAPAQPQALAKDEVLGTLQRRQHIRQACKAAANNTARAALLAVIVLEVLRLALGGKIVKQLTGHPDPVGEASAKLWTEAVSLAQASEQQAAQRGVEVYVVPSGLGWSEEGAAQSSRKLLFRAGRASDMAAKAPSIDVAAARQLQGAAQQLPMPTTLQNT